MMTTRQCGKCGAEIAENAAEGLCPACMLRLGLGGESTMETVDLPGAQSADSPINPRGGAPMVEPVETQTMPPAPGTRVQYFGDYVLLEEVARGGMGIIYRARQVSLNRFVALKMIRSGEFAGEEDVKRFHVEAEAAANLQHPNIVAIHEVGMHERRHYFTMDFVEGQNLAQAAGGSPMPAQRAARYAKTIAEAIHFAHQRGTLHRDLKPQNVLIDEADRVRITDFGLAKQTRRDSGLTVTGAVMGSPSYMPPEQAQGRLDLVGPASDVYGVGAILYELLTGRAPFRGDTPAATMQKVIVEEPAAPSRLNSTVPRDLETICLKCLEKSIERRYPTARALAEDLGRFLDGEPIQARRAGTLHRAVSWWRRHPWAGAAVLSMLILGLAGLAYGLWQQTQVMAWRSAHPGQVPAEDWRASRLEGIAGDIISFWMLPYFVLYFYIYLSRPVPSLKKAFSPSALLLPAQHMSRFSTAGFLFVGLAGSLLSLWVIMRGISVFVWEGYFSLNAVFASALLFYSSFVLVLRLMREQMGAAIGLRPRQEAMPLRSDQLEPIRQALFAGRYDEAIELYAKFSGVTPAEARAEVRKEAAKLYTFHPERFSADPTIRLRLDKEKSVGSAFESWGTRRFVARFIFLVALAGSAVLVPVWMFGPSEIVRSWLGAFLWSAAAGMMLFWTFCFFLLIKKKAGQAFLSLAVVILLGILVQLFIPSVDLRILDRGRFLLAGLLGFPLGFLLIPLAAGRKRPRH